MPYDAVLAETVNIHGHGGDLVEAYTARPLAPGPRGGVLVIHHMPGYDRGTKEIVRRFAELGYNAICVNLYSREAPGASPDDAAATARANGGVPDERFVGDAAGAADWLRALPTSNGRVGSIGYCSGGRQAFLTSIEVDVQAAVDCYGAFVVGTPPEGFPLQVRPLADRVPEVHAPVLGLFGNEDIDEIAPSVEWARAQGMPVEGPVPPDTAFYLAVRKKRYDAIVCMYHDQGHIPLKLLDFEAGVNVALGLPIIRTSVDHGTAFDIAGKGVASTASLVSALEFAARLACL